MPYEQWTRWFRKIYFFGLFLWQERQRAEKNKSLTFYCLATNVGPIVRMDSSCGGYTEAMANGFTTSRRAAAVDPTTYLTDILTVTRKMSKKHSTRKAGENAPTVITWQVSIKELVTRSTASKNSDVVVWVTMAARWQTGGRPLITKDQLSAPLQHNTSLDCGETSKQMTTRYIC